MIVHIVTEYQYEGEEPEILNHTANYPSLDEAVLDIHNLLVQADYRTILVLEEVKD
jgi:hypothetical protein